MIVNALQASKRASHFIYFIYCFILYILFTCKTSRISCDVNKVIKKCNHKFWVWDAMFYITKKLCYYIKWCFFGFFNFSLY